MWLNKKIIKRVSSWLIFITIFMFSVVLAADDTLYVWSAETEPISVQTSGNAVNNDTTNNSLNLESGGAVLIEQTTGKVIYDHNMHEKLRPASVTKVMSILLIMRAIDSGQISLEDKVPCSENAAGMGALKYG